MKFCFNCGTKLPEGTKFCPECGQKIPVAAQPAPVQEPVSAPAPQPVMAPPPVVEAPKPVVEAPKPVVEAPKPVVEAPKPVVEAPQPVVEAPKPVVEAPKPVVEAPKPVVEAPKPVVEAPKPVVEAPQPVAGKSPVVSGVYGAPVQHSFTASVHSTADQSLPRTYQIPTAQPAAPQQPRRAPAQKPVAVAPTPQQPAAQTYTPPVQQPAAAPRPRKAASGNGGNFLDKLGGKRGIALIAGAVGLILLIVLLVSCIAGGGKSDDPNLGLYEGTSCIVMGMDLGADGEWIELKSGGKATLNLMGTEYSCKWEVDGEDLTVIQAGDEFYGTLADGVIVLDFGGMVYTYVNNEYTAPSNQDAPGKDAGEVSEAGYWTLLRVDSDDPNNAMDEDTVQLLKGMGMEMFVELKADGTGTFMMEELASITWSNGMLTAPDGNQLPYAIKNDQLIVKMDGMTMVFVRGESSSTGTDLPVAGTNPYAEFWGGHWYGWWVVWTGTGEFAELEDSGWDAYAIIDVYDDNTGYVTLWDTDCSKQDPMAGVVVSFEMGVTEYGCMKSESGFFYDQELGHADWNVDVGATVVRMFDRMIAIEGTYVDPTNPANSLDYYVILRPWGMDWEDIRYADTSDTLYSDMMPFHYDSWYLPLINQGVTVVPSSYEEGLDMLQ